MDQPQISVWRQGVMLALLVAIAAGCVAACAAVQDSAFRAEYGFAGAAAAIVLVFVAATVLGISPEKAIASIRPSNRGTPASTPAGTSPRRRASSPGTASRKPDRLK
jgi:hypothetical protein